MPFKVFSYVLLTFLGSFFTTMNIEVSVIATLICVWICMMPRLKYEEFTFKDKLPKFLIKSDLPNNIIKLLPIALFFMFCSQKSVETPAIAGSGLNFIIYFIPMIFGCLHYFIYNKYENEQDWAMPLITSFLIVIGCQFVVGDFSEFVKIFSATEIVTNGIYYSWLLLLQVAIVYAIFRILSIVVASRSFCLLIVGLLFTAFAYIQNLYNNILHLDFKPNDIIKFKEFFALLSILHKDNIDISKIAPAVAVLIVIGLVTTLLGKNASTYSFKIRLKSFLCGCLLIAISFVSLNILYPNQTFERYNTNAGFVTYIVHNLNKQNTFSAELQNKINAEIIAMEQTSTEQEGTANQDANDHSDFTVPQNQPSNDTPAQTTVVEQPQTNMFADFTVPQ
jgi:hypothetical protein